MKLGSVCRVDQMESNGPTMRSPANLVGEALDASAYRLRKKSRNERVCLCDSEFAFALGVLLLFVYARCVRLGSPFDARCFCLCTHV